MTVADWLAEATDRLARAGVDSPRLDAQVIAAHALGHDRAWILAHPESSVESQVLESSLVRRESREPLAYIVGYREFYGRVFNVDPRVLIPRQETEILVERVLLWLNETGRDRNVLDIGTGSGCVGLTIKAERPLTDVTLSDISMGAIQVAYSNAERLGLDVKIVESDLYEAFEGASFDVIVCNPPYVSHADDLDPEVREYEPTIALYAEAGGVGIYRRLASEFAGYLDCNALVLEIGLGQEEMVAAIFTEYDWQHEETLLDLARIPRVMVFTPPAS
ncbi:peptide chain release factor N(5)-glutamine methyltransferase [Kamptonema cortianum]|nr:peptide chain release factor N(5)-glutamine methyltransferase [Geitlerinema splendidum]MDK3157653.1 peptide chain release factor N(5)-glutamine methyltransferase [Kamptonema cortianum]